MGFKKGESGNPSGRPDGSKNKVNEELRSMISDFLNGEFDNIKTQFENLKPNEKVKFYVDLLQYALPKMQAVSVASEFENFTDEQLDQIIDGLKNKHK